MSIKKHFKNQLDSVAYAFDNLDKKNSERLLEDCLETIRNGQGIVTTALGKNVPICEKFIGTLISVGLRANFMHTNSAIHGDLGLVKKNDLVIILSKSGETEETLTLCHLLNQRKSTNWVVTFNEKSMICKLVTNKVVLKLINEGDPWNIVPNNSSVIFLVFLQALAMAITEKLAIKLKSFKNNHPGGDIGKKLQRVQT